MRQFVDYLKSFTHEIEVYLKSLKPSIETVLMGIYYLMYGLVFCGFVAVCMFFYGFIVGDSALRLLFRKVFVVVYIFVTFRLCHIFLADVVSFLVKSVLSVVRYVLSIRVPEFVYRVVDDFFDMSDQSWWFMLRVVFAIVGTAVVVMYDECLLRTCSWKYYYRILIFHDLFMIYLAYWYFTGFLEPLDLYYNDGEFLITFIQTQMNEIDNPVAVRIVMIDFLLKGMYYAIRGVFAKPGPKSPRQLLFESDGAYSRRIRLVLACTVLEVFPNVVNIVQTITYPF